jgi:hypothetical protein
VTSQTEAGAILSNGASPLQLFESPQGLGTSDFLAKARRKFLEPGAYARDGSFVYAKNPGTEELLKSYAVLAGEIAGVAPFAVVQAVYAHNPLAWWVLWRCADPARRNPQMAGLAAYVPLNDDGCEALRRGAFNARDPDLRFVAAEGEDPAALYLWGIVAHGLSDLAGKLVGHAIGLNVYENLPMIGTIGTEEGLAALRRSSKSASDAAALTIGSTFEIRLPPKHIAHQREMRVWEGGDGGAASAATRTEAGDSTQ